MKNSQGTQLYFKIFNNCNCNNCDRKDKGN